MVRPCTSLETPDGTLWWTSFNISQSSVDFFCTCQSSIERLDPLHFCNEKSDNVRLQLWTKIDKQSKAQMVQRESTSYISHAAAVFQPGFWEWVGFKKEHKVVNGLGQ